MELVAIDALSGLRASLEAPEDERAEVFRRRVADPLQPFWEVFFRMAPAPQTDDPGNIARSMGLYHAGLGVEEGLAALDRLQAAGAWEGCVQAVRDAWALLNPEAHGVNLPRIHFTVVLADPHIVTERVGNYTGMGGSPGTIMMMVWPTDFNVPRLPAATVHEVNHNVRFSVEPWTMETTLGQYMVAEGLGEAMAEQMYDEEMVGQWARALTEAQIEELKPRYRDVLNMTGMDMRSYIFGDWAAQQFQFPPQGIPDFAGYTMGYRLLRAYQAHTGKTAAEATFVPAREIIRESHFFD